MIRSIFRRTYDPGSVRLAASMDRLLAARDLRRGGDAAPAAIDVSHMDKLSESMRALLPQPQRAAYDRNWAQSELARPAPIAPKAFTPPPALVTFSPTPAAAVKAPVAPALTVSAPALSALLAHAGPATAADVHRRSGDIAIFAAARGRAPRDMAELDKSLAGADARSLAAGLDADRRGLSDMPMV